MTAWTPEHKTRTILRAAGVVILLLGVSLSSMPIFFGYSTIMSLVQRDWLSFSVDLGMFGLFFPFTLFFIYAGWRNISHPESANPRLLLIAVFLIIYFKFDSLGSRLIFEAPGARDAWDFLRPWSKLYEFGLTLLCSMLYYACCRRLSRLTAFTPAQRTALAGPPSIQFCGLLGFILLGVWLAFLHRYEEVLDPVILWLWIASLVLVYWFYRIFYAVLAAYMAAPVPPVPEPTQGLQGLHS